MATAVRTVEMNAPIGQVWSVLADYASISAWAPNVEHSTLTTERSGGVGAVRRIQASGSTLLETITAWEPEDELSYSITGLPRVIRSVTSTWRLSPAAGGTAVTLTTDIDAGPRPPQRAVARFVARKLGRAADEMLAGLADHLRRQEASP